MAGLVGVGPPVLARVDFGARVVAGVEGMAGVDGVADEEVTPARDRAPLDSVLGGVAVRAGVDDVTVEDESAERETNDPPVDRLAARSPWAALQAVSSRTTAAAVASGTVGVIFIGVTLPQERTWPDQDRRDTTERQFDRPTNR